MYDNDYNENYRREKSQSYKTLFTLSIIVNLFLAAGLGFLYVQKNVLEQEISDYAQTISSIAENSMNYELQLNMTRSQLNYYKDLVNQLSSSASTQNGSPSVIGSALVPIVAVKTVQYGFTMGYEGEVMEANLELIRGEGRVLVNTEIINGADMQASLRTAASVASQLTGISFSGTDIILTIEGGSDVEIVDGPSAGAVLTVAIYAAITGQEPLENVYMTGTISSDGTVGDIGGVEYKALAVAESGGSVFLVPESQSTIITYQPVTRTLGRHTFTFYEAVVIDLESYLANNGYIVDVVEVSNIEEAIEYFFDT
jgi:predicted S18 family serine protease